MHHAGAAPESAIRSLSFPRALVVAAAVGGAFGVGLVCGGSARAEAPPPSTGDALARADERTAAYEALVKASTSTWHAEVSSPEPAAPATPPRPPAATATEPAVAPAVPASADVVAAVREEAARAPEVVRATEKDSDAASGDDADEGDVERARPPDPARLRSALDKVLADRPTSAAPAQQGERRYAVQLASAGTPDGARAIADGFSQRGFAPVVVAAEVPGRGAVYRVRLVGLTSRAAAEALKARVGQGLVVTD